MLNKIILSLCLLFPVNAMCQEFDASKFEPVVVEEVVESSLVDKFEEEAAARIKEMKEIANNFKEMSKKALEDIKKIKDQLPVSMPNPNEDFVTRDEVLAMVQEEVEKHVEITLKKRGEDISKTVDVSMKPGDNIASYKSVSVSGYSGTFEIGPDEVLTHVDGVPVQYTGKNSSGNYTSSAGRYMMITNGIFNRNTRVRVIQPQTLGGKSCRVVNGKMVCN